MPVRSQFRPDLVPPPAAPCTSTQSCRRSATATGLDHKSPGVREARTIGKRSLYHRTSEQMSGAESVSYLTSQLLPPLWPRVSFHVPWRVAYSPTTGGTHKVGIPKENCVRLPDVRGFEFGDLSLCRFREFFGNLWMLQRTDVVVRLKTS